MYDTKRTETRTLRAGAGRAPIQLPGELFPTEGFTGVSDPLHARLLLLDSQERVALVSLEMTSLPDERIALLQETVAESAGLPPENVWICVTHTFSAPHFTPEHLCKTPADQEKNRLLWLAVEAAVRGAASQAVAGLREARLGHKSGSCDVNVNRDVLTAEGWWLGLSETGFSDKTVTVVRLETPDGEPIAVLFNHSVRPAVMERPPGSTDEALVSADLAGAACGLVEQEYGGATTALFFMGAAGDQAPSLTGARSIAEIIGSRLGAEVLRLSEEIDCRPCGDPIVIERAAVELPGQEMMNTQLIRPTKQHVFASWAGARPAPGDHRCGRRGSGRRESGAQLPDGSEHTRAVTVSGDAGGHHGQRGGQVHGRYERI